MKYYICIDGGTTNTRVSLLKGEDLLDTVRIPLGARASMEGTAPLKRALKDGIGALLSRFSLKESDITRILASGMITSEFGLCSLSHLPAPAGIGELHAAMHETLMEEIAPIPFVFIRGVKMMGKSALDTDMMRGEETELYGLTDTVCAGSLYVLPGSHSKLIETDREGRIAHFSTMLTGEMIAALSSGTILRDAVDLSIKEISAEELLGGCRYAMEQGISKALFKVRIMKNQFGKDALATYSFFVGAVLAPEIQAVLASSASRVVIGGKAQIKHATELLLRALCDKEITVVDEQTVNRSSALGAVRIFEFQKCE